MLKKPAILVLVSFRRHLVHDVKKELSESKTELVIIPGGLAPILQPLVVSVNKPFKDNIRRVYDIGWSMGTKKKIPVEK